MTATGCLGGSFSQIRAIGRDTRAETEFAATMRNA